MADKFRKSIERLGEKAKKEPKQERVFTELVMDGEQAMLEDLEAQIAEYEAKRGNGKRATLLDHIFSILPTGRHNRMKEGG